MFLSSTTLLLGCFVVVHGGMYVGRTRRPPACPPGPCPYVSCLNPVQGKCCLTCPEKECYHNGVPYPHGQTVQEYCNTCTCNNGVMKCTKENCQKECYHNGVPYPHGQTVQEYCNTCTCNNGVMKCTKENCQKECIHNGVPYPHGQTVQDYCNTCTCNNGLMKCTKENCLEKPGTCPRSTRPAICTSSCSGDTNCPGNQKCCPSECGDTCMTPENQCHLVDCRPINCRRQYTPPGECCPVCRRSRRRRPDCTYVFCAPASCENWYTPRNGCCRACRGNRRGNIY